HEENRCTPVQCFGQATQVVKKRIGKPEKGCSTDRVIQNIPKLKVPVRNEYLNTFRENCEEDRYDPCLQVPLRYCAWPFAMVQNPENHQGNNAEEGKVAIIQNFINDARMGLTKISKEQERYPGHEKEDDKNTSRGF
ncbi:MAG: hypothetical protein NTW84_03125, partial [Methanothrix sp.]|nr:hypothetical protein [Methanothrix sp.]